MPLHLGTVSRGQRQRKRHCKKGVRMMEKDETIVEAFKKRMSEYRILMEVADPKVGVRNRKTGKAAADASAKV